MNTHQVIDVLRSVGTVSTVPINNVYKEFVVLFPLLPGEGNKRIANVARIRALRKQLIDAIGTARLRRNTIACFAVDGVGKMVMHVKVEDA
jgi:hypothetical protein